MANSSYTVIGDSMSVGRIYDKIGKKVKYLYSRKDGIIHDKHCDNVKDILDEDLLWTEEYFPNLKPCPECMIQAYVSAGAKDPKEMETYLSFFENYNRYFVTVLLIFTLPFFINSAMI